MYIYNYNIYIYTIFKNYLIVGFTYSLLNTADPTKIIIMGNHNLIMNVWEFANVNIILKLIVYNVIINVL